MYAVYIKDGKADITPIDVLREEHRFYHTAKDGPILKSSSLGRRMKPTIPDAKKYFRAKQRREIANQQLIIIRAQQQIEQMQGWIKDLD